jgi:hypothetical protein
MKFELLPNELLIDVFGYLNIIDLLRAFHGLNLRLNNLLLNHSPGFHLNLKSIRKQDFDFICQEHLPTIAHHILSLSLSNDDDTPEQISCFVSHDFPLRQFIYLQSLSLYQIRFDNAIHRILQELPDLQHLISLKINKLQYHYDKENLLYLFNIIWSLPKLIHCHLLDFSANYNYSEFAFPAMISSSIEYLSIENVQFDINQFFNLTKSTPHLRQLSIAIKTSSNIDQSQWHTVSSLTVLKIEFSPQSFDDLTNLFQYIPNLYHLAFLSESIKIIGHEWEQLITNHLLKLKVFELIMSTNFQNIDDKEGEVDRLLDSFRTPFWLDIHQWFVRCDWTEQPNFDFTNSDMLFYTLPYFQTFFYYSELNHSKSTSPDDRDHWSYDHVHDLLLDNHRFIQYFSRYPIRFPNVRYLRLKSFLLNSFRSTSTIFDQLIVLYIIGYDDNDPSDLQALLDHIPRLSSLKFNTYCPPQLLLKHSSIRQLYFPLNELFGEQQCTEFLQSSLFQQCEVLQIGIDNRDIALDLLTKMPNLRSLSFTCRDDKWTEVGKSNRGKQDELMDWLKDHLPNNVWITRPQFRLIRIWIA